MKKKDEGEMLPPPPLWGGVVLLVLLVLLLLLPPPVKLRIHNEKRVKKGWVTFKKFNLFLKPALSSEKMLTITGTFCHCLFFHICPFSTFILLHRITGTRN